MITLTVFIIIYAVALSGCLYALTRNPNKQRERGEALSNQSAPDAAKRTLQSFKDIEQKQMAVPSDVGLLIIESMRTAIDQLNVSDAAKNKATDVERAEIKTVRD
jgi:hypothetical protein